MAMLTGLDGNFAFDSGFAIDINTWSADVTIETTDVSSFDAKGTGVNVGWRERIPVMGSLTATASGFLEHDADPAAADVLDGAAFDTAAMIGTLTLTAQSGDTWSCAAVLTGVSISVTVGSASTGSYSFESNGTITQAWN